jgi:hypothetical protein
MVIMEIITQTAIGIQVIHTITEQASTIVMDGIHLIITEDTIIMTHIIITILLITLHIIMEDITTTTIMGIITMGEILIAQIQVIASLDIEVV